MFGLNSMIQGRKRYGEEYGKYNLEYVKLEMAEKHLGKDDEPVIG